MLDAFDSELKICPNRQDQVDLDFSVCGGFSFSLDLSFETIKYYGNSLRSDTSSADDVSFL